MATDPAELIYSMLGKAGLGAFTEAYNQGSQWKQDALQSRLLNAKVAEAQRAQQQDDAYQQAVSQWSQNGADPSQLVRIAAQFPDKAEAAGKLYELQDKQQVASARSYYGQVYSGVQSNAPTLARDQVQRHRDAAAAAGMDTTDDDHVLDAFKTGDTEGLAAAKALSLAHLYATDPAGFAKQFGVNDTNHFGTTGAGEIFDQRTGEVKSGGHAAPNMQRIEVTNPDGSVTTRFVNISGGGGPASSGRGKADGSFDTFHANFLGPVEGGYADRDGASGAPVNYGVNQKFNPDINVKNLTPEQGKDVLRQRYWKASGADKLPAGLAEIHGDTAVNMGVGTAKRLLAQSRGDPERYLELREARYRSIGGKDLGNWLNRNNRLREYVGLQDGSPVEGGGASQGGYSFRTKPAGSADDLPTEAVTAMAAQYLAGDRTVMQNLGRGAQGSKNIVKLRTEIAKQMSARGITGPDVAATMAQYAGDVAASRTAGNRMAQVDLAVHEAKRVLPLARAASMALPRSGFLPFSRAQQAIRSGTNDPRLRQFVAANNALVNVYARAISPVGGGTVADKEHARELLDTAYDDKSYQAVLNTMAQEMRAALQAPTDVRADLRRSITGQQGGATGFRILKVRPK